MKSKKEIKEWLLANAVDEYGDLNLSDLDFSDFEGDVAINRMKVRGNLFQCCQIVRGNLHQHYQKVDDTLYQHDQDFKTLYNHKHREDEKIDAIIDNSLEPTFSTIIIKKRG